VVYTGYIASCFTTCILINLKDEHNAEDEKENEALQQEMGSSFCNSVLGILLIHNIIMMTASGMSMRFIPIFMSEYVKLTPFWVQFNEFIMIFAGIFTIGLAEYLSNKLGKVWCIITMDFIGIVLFFTVIHVYDY